LRMHRKFAMPHCGACQRPACNLLQQYLLQSHCSHLQVAAASQSVQEHVCIAKKKLTLLMVRAGMGEMKALALATRAATATMLHFMSIKE
jgi:hypothetical protein